MSKYRGRGTMQLLKAFKTLFMHYFNIIPTYIIVYVIRIVSASAIPLFGPILVLPLKVSVAHAMLTARIRPKLKEKIHFSLANENGNYFKNLIYLFVSGYFFLVPILAGVMLQILFEVIFGFDFLSNLFSFLRKYNPELNSPFIAYVLGFDYVSHRVPFMVFSITLAVCAVISVVLSLMFAMTPFLLADDVFDQNKDNPIKASVRMLKGHYLRLFLLRFPFFLWLLWIVLGWIPFLFITVMFGFAQGPLPGEEYMLAYVLIYLFSIPAHFLFVSPLYTMVHAVLYGDLRYRLDEQPE